MVRYNYTIYHNIVIQHLNSHMSVTVCYQQTAQLNFYCNENFLRFLKLVILMCVKVQREISEFLLIVINCSTKSTIV